MGVALTLHVWNIVRPNSRRQENFRSSLQKLAGFLRVVCCVSTTQRSQFDLGGRRSDIIEEFMDLDMEPKPEAQWWTSTYMAEDGVTLKVGSMGESWEMPFVAEFDLLEYRFRRNGKGIQGTERMLKTGMGSWWRNALIYRAKGLSLKTKCERVVSHVVSTALNGRVNWPWSGERVNESQTMGIKDPGTYSQTKDESK